MAPESEDKSVLEFLPWYNLPRIMVLHNAVSQHNMRTTNTDCIYLFIYIFINFCYQTKSLEIHLWVPQIGLVLTQNDL